MRKPVLCHVRTTKAQISLHLISVFVVRCLDSIIPIRGVIKKYMEKCRHFFILWSIVIKLQYMTEQYIHVRSWLVITMQMLVLIVLYCCRQGNATLRDSAQFALKFAMCFIVNSNLMSYNKLMFLRKHCCHFEGQCCKIIHMWMSKTLFSSQQI